MRLRTINELMINNNDDDYFSFKSPFYSSGCKTPKKRTTHSIIVLQKVTNVESFGY